MIEKSQLQFSRPPVFAEGDAFPGRKKNLWRPIRIAAYVVTILAAVTAWAGVGGSISGIVTDPGGRALPNAEVVVKQMDTGLTYATRTDSNGDYAAPVLPVGRYQVDIHAKGFSAYERKDVVLDTNSALRIDATLQVGEFSQTITVSDNAAHIDTSSTQMGEVITGKQMSAVPLNGRSYTDLLALQPGVAPTTSLTSDTVQDVGASALNPSGDLNPGTISINGQREFANAFIVNGSDAEEDVNAGTSIIPNLDSIDEFRILTNNFGAEYGGYSGGQINVVTKSGTNAFHGDVFEFLRNTNLDARNYFSPTRGDFHQNQFGGTFGGPIWRDKIFFFTDYQGTRQTEGIDTGLISVPTQDDRNGSLADMEGSLSGVVNGPYWAGLLSQKLGYTVVPGENYYLPGCINSSQCVLPNGVLPRSAWSAPAQNLLGYIPSPNVGAGSFSTSAYDQQLRDDKGAARVDAKTSLGLISAYYFLDRYTQDSPYPVAQGGASVPGFQAGYQGIAQLFSLGDTQTFSATAFNEFHFSFMRNYNDLGKPEGGLGVSLASQGFVTGAGTPGIVPLDPKGEGVENIVFNSFSIGTNTNELKQANNTFQWVDAFSKVLGNHSLKIGGEFHYDQVNVNPIAQFNGNFLFTGSETGSDFADFLLGIPSQYNQSQLNPFYGRNKYAGAFGQDSWRLRSNITLNYGIRWDRIEPWYEKYNQISTFEPGRQSLVFPGAPPGILYPTDPGVRRTLAPPGDSFSPRVGVAYAPGTKNSGLWERVLGAPGETSVRAGFGTYYTSIEALTLGVLAANAPYGTTYSSPAPPLFATPFITASNGQNLGQPFPYTFAPLNSSRSNPDPNIDWGTYLPISGIPGYPTTNRIPYTEEWMLSVERQLGMNTILSAGYVGSAAHRLLVLEEANPGDPSLCLSLSQAGQVASGSATCGPFGESNVFTTASGRTINGTRGPLGSNFGSDANQATIGGSNYNALELSARHTSGSLEFFAAYTYSKAMDQSSNLGEEVNPIHPALSYALSAFDIKHNFVVSYDYQLPFGRVFHAANRWTKDWRLSGITRFSTGFPVTLVNYGDNSLLGAEPNGVNNYGIDEPEYNGGSLHLNHNPRTNDNFYFDGTPFGCVRQGAAVSCPLQPLGTPGNAKRRFFYGPGTENYDAALSKNISLTESKDLLFRIEAFNVFNHAQFEGPASIDGNIGSSTFGKAVSAAPPRILQAAAKFVF